MEFIYDSMNAHYADANIDVSTVIAAGWCVLETLYEIICDYIYAHKINKT